MSWDIWIFKFDGKPPILEDLPDDFRFPYLGKAKEIRFKISSALKTVDWSDSTWGIFEGKGFSIEFAIGSDEIVDQMTLFIRGSGDVVSIIAQLCKVNQWHAYDISAGDYIDLENPSNESWTAFQNYRDQILEMYKGKKK